MAEIKQRKRRERQMNKLNVLSATTLALISGLISAPLTATTMTIDSNEVKTDTIGSFCATEAALGAAELHGIDTQDMDSETVSKITDRHAAWMRERNALYSACLAGASAGQSALNTSVTMRRQQQ
jgi:hypothetical protein